MWWLVLEERRIDGCRGKWWLLFSGSEELIFKATSFLAAKIGGQWFGDYKSNLRSLDDHSRRTQFTEILLKWANRRQNGKLKGAGMEQEHTEVSSVLWSRVKFVKQLIHLACLKNERKCTIKSTFVLNKSAK